MSNIEVAGIVIVGLGAFLGLVATILSLVNTYIVKPSNDKHNAQQDLIDKILDKTNETNDKTNKTLHEINITLVKLNGTLETTNTKVIDLEKKVDSNTSEIERLKNIHFEKNRI